MKYIILLLIIVSATSCDIRRKDKLMDDAGKKALQALKDSTTINLIDTSYNFGKVTEGELVTFNFRFSNSGKKPLIITNVSASCGCTVAEKPEKPVMPGESSFIKAVFNSRGKQGHNDKKITVTSNANPPFPMLTLTGEVEPKSE